jgi:hypothetical protein
MRRFTLMVIDSQVGLFQEKAEQNQNERFELVPGELPHLASKLLIIQYVSM